VSESKLFEANLSSRGRDNTVMFLSVLPLVILIASTPNPAWSSSPKVADKHFCPNCVKNSPNNSWVWTAFKQNIYASVHLQIYLPNYCV